MKVHQYKFLECLTVSEKKDISSRDSKVYNFQVQNNIPVTSERLFWEAAINTFLLNPKYHKSGQSMDALEDSLFAGLLESSDSRSNIVWSCADSVQQTFIKKQVVFFHHLAQSLHPESKFRSKSRDGGVVLCLYLVCSNEGNRNALDDYLSLYKVHELHL